MGFQALQMWRQDAAVRLADSYTLDASYREAKEQAAIHKICATLDVSEPRLKAGIDRLRDGNALPPDANDIDSAINEIAMALANTNTMVPPLQQAPAILDAQRAGQESAGTAGGLGQKGAPRRLVAPAGTEAPASQSAVNPGATWPTATNAMASPANASGGADPASQIMDDLRYLLQVLGIPPEQIDRILSLFLQLSQPADGGNGDSGTGNSGIPQGAPRASSGMQTGGGNVSGSHATGGQGGPSGAALQTPAGSPYQSQSLANSSKLSHLTGTPEVAVAPSAPSQAAGPQGSTDTYVARDPALEAEIAKREKTDPAGAAALRELSQQPVSKWFNGSQYDGREIKNYMDGAEAAGKKGLLTMYDIPGRDLGNFSKGGAASSEAYLANVNTVAQSIGNRKADVILEPDALMHSTRMDPAAGSARRQLMHQAVDILTAQPNTTVSIAAGGPGWAPPAKVAELLIESGIEKARNFSVGESSFTPVGKLTNYGDAVVAELAKRGVTGVHYSVETARNGVEGHATGTASWAEMDGAASGYRPTTDQAIIQNPNVSAYNWIKTPWHADGRIAPAGSFIPDYAIKLVDNAHANKIW